MKIFDKLFKKKGKGNSTIASDDTILVEDAVDTVDKKSDSMDEMQQVAETISKIRKQTPIQAIFIGNQNEKALAENDALISNVIKNILNWLSVITSAETIRKEEYDELTEQMLQFDEDMNEQLAMQIKFKKAYETMQQKGEEQKRLVHEVESLKAENAQIKKEYKLLKILTIAALGISCVAIILAIIL